MKSQTTILRPNIIGEIKSPISKSWVRAAGSLKHYKKELEKHIKQVRTEWRRKTSR